MKRIFFAAALYAIACALPAFAQVVAPAPPASVTRRMLSICGNESGVSRGTRISLRRSLRCTSAARWTRFDDIPFARAPSVPIEQGQITIPAVRNEPLAMPAEKSMW